MPVTINFGMTTCCHSAFGMRPCTRVCVCVWGCRGVCVCLCKLSHVCILTESIDAFSFCNHQHTHTLLARRRIHLMHHLSHESVSHLRSPTLWSEATTFPPIQIGSAVASPKSHSVLSDFSKHKVNLLVFKVSPMFQN